MEGQSNGRKTKIVVSEDLENRIDEVDFETVNSDSEFIESDNEIGDADDEVKRVNVTLEGVGVLVNFVPTEKDDEHEYDSSGSLHSLHDSDSDGQHWPEFNSDVDLVDPKLMKGLVFSSKKHLTEVILEYSRKNKYEVKFLNNDKKRVRVVCRNGCPWRLWGSPMSSKNSNDQTWQIKTYQAEHRCLRVIKNRNLTAKCIAKKYLHKFSADPTYSSTLLKQDVDIDYVTIVSLTKCSREREWALEKVIGNWRDQYEKIYEYLAELRQTNPGTTTICYLDLRLFQRMYVCLEACKLGYKSGCRPIISVDGCHLKGYYGGHILAAVGIDANDCIYPIAYAVVESEYEGSWCWFLELLQNNLEITNSYHISFMSDRQKGLVEAIAELFSNGEHRTCVRHLYNNFKSKHTSKTLKNLLWKAARATTVNEYKAAMTEMENIDSKAHEWLGKKDPKQWSKSHFSTRAKCDMLLNNLCESFNKFIMEARDKPILTCMGTIRSLMMQRIIKRRAAADKYIGILCPKIQKKLDCNVEQAARCWPEPAGRNKFQVQHGPANQHIVDLDSKTCSCRKWDLTGVPCCHAISCIFSIHGRPEAYVNECYTKSKQLEIYSHFISPIKGPNQWSPVIDMEPILPPELRRPPGRPHKIRRKEADETSTSGKVGKKGETKGCSKCGQKGHNVRICKGVAVGCNRNLNQNFRSARQQARIKLPPATNATRHSSQQTQTSPQPSKQLLRSSTQQPQRKKLAVKRKPPPTELPSPTIIRWMPTPRICSETDHGTISMDQGTIYSGSALQEPPTRSRPSMD